MIVNLLFYKKMYVKLVSLVLLFIMIFSLAGCQSKQKNDDPLLTLALGEPTSSPSPTPSPGKIKLGVLFDGRKGRDFRVLREKMEEYAKGKNIELIFESTREQDKALEGMLGQGINALVVRPLSSEMRDIVKRCNEKKVVVVAYDEFIDQPGLNFYITFDELSMGRAQIKEAVIFTGGSGKALVIKDDRAEPFLGDKVQDDKDSFLKNAIITAVEQSDQSGKVEDEAEKLVGEELAKNPGINAILCKTDAIARGSARALRKGNRLGNTFLAGGGGDLENLRMILAGEQTVDVGEDLESLAKMMVDISVDLVEERVPQKSKNTNVKGVQTHRAEVPLVVINKDNLYKDMGRLGYKKGDLKASGGK